MSSALLGIATVLNRFARLESAADDMGGPLEDAGEYMLGSVALNFEAEGRPQKWLENKSGTRILNVSGDLQNSVTNADALDVYEDEFSIGTSVAYAARHQFGYPGGKGRGRSQTPARPFLLFQTEDEGALLEIFNRHFSEPV